MKPKDLARVVVDTTVQPKAVMFPTDAKLLNRAREVSLTSFVLVTRACRGGSCTGLPVAAIDNRPSAVANPLLTGASRLAK
jgi:hypothetical protein